jgi:hypothetical protein
VGVSPEPAGGTGILGSQSSHSICGFSCSRKRVPSFTAGLPGSSGVANAMPPATSARSDSTLTSSPRKSPRFTSTPPTSQNREPTRTSRANRWGMNALMCAAVASGASSVAVTEPTSIPR